MMLFTCYSYDVKLVVTKKNMMSSWWTMICVDIAEDYVDISAQFRRVDGG
jgi:isocitrate/isopropylmalate dehydrogenase